MLTPPSPICEAHDVASFSCDRPELDAWLKVHALHSHRHGNAKTQVVLDAEAGSRRVVAFYSLAPASVVRAQVERKLRTNAPDPVPMILLARLAVDRAYAGRGLGKHLLLDVFRRAEAAAWQIGGRGLIAHAKDENALRFYLRWKFQRMPGDPLLVAIAFEVVRASLEAARQKTA